MWQRASSWVAEAAAVFAKDWRCEFRTRYALNTLALFACTTLVVVSASLGPLGTSKEQAFAVLPVLLWVILLFAASAGLPRGFVYEEEMHTATALRLSAKPSALFAGKLAYGVTLLFALEILVAPVYCASPWRSPATVSPPAALSSPPSSPRLRGARPSSRSSPSRSSSPS